MSETDAFDPASTPAVEVLVYRGDHLVTTEWCDSEDEAIQVVAKWSDRRGVRCTVRDVSSDVRSHDMSDDDPVEDDADEYAAGAN